jgi:hypothetical protein
MAAQPQHTHQIIRPALDTTYTLTMEHNPADAEEANGIYGPQWRYFFRDAEMIYADEGLHKALQESGAQRGNTVCITKTKEGRAVRWLVETMPGTARRAHQPQAAQTRPATVATMPAPQQQATPSAAPSDERLAECFRTAIRIAATAEQLGKEEGLAIRASFEDVRAMAATIFINRTREDIGR